MTLDDFYKQKIAALLHDPPSKCWFLDGSRGRRDHESEAKEIAKQLFGDEIVKLIDSNMVKKADHLASSLDRWLLEVAMGGKYEPGAYKEKRSKLLNQFGKKDSGFYSLETIIPPAFDSLRNDFITMLIDLLTEDKYRQKWREIYHILYACLEYCWAQKVEVIGPADTRVPTHSIFDHLYSTATALNMLDSKGTLSGYFVTIDLAGIQTFISASRKMLDLWAGSWLVSALTWSIVEEFVKAIGPDILVLPTARGNPFYYHTFMGIVRASGRKKEYEDIGKSFYGYDGYPKNPVVPGTVSFVLPKREDILPELRKEISDLDLGSTEEIKNSIRSIYHRKWKALSNSLADNEIKNACNELGVFDVPPLTLRVAVEEVSTKLVLDSPLSKLFHDGSFCRSENHSRSAEFMAYHVAFHNTGRDRKDQARFKTSPFVNLELTKYTKKSYSVCYVCGVLPALEKSEHDEKLCAYCAIRRKLTNQTGLGSALDALFDFGGVHAIEAFAIPSVSDVAARPFVRKLCETPEARKVAKEHFDWIPWLASCEEIGKGWRYLKGLDSERQLFGREGNGKDETQENRRRTEALFGGLREKAGFSFRPNPYFGVLRADADNMGNLVLGLLGKSDGKDGKAHYGVPSLDFELFKHLSGTTENQKLKAIIGAISKKDFDQAADIAIEEFDSGRSRESLANDFKCLYYRLKEGCSLASRTEPDRNWTSNLVLSPSYHSTISRMLMKLAIEAAQIVENTDGELIYAGGDDVLAILPATRALEASNKLRERFRGENSQIGFLRLVESKQAYVQSMGDLGVSLSLLFTHCLYPLSISLLQSREDEEIAKKSKWSIAMDNFVEKNSLVIEYSPRGGQSTVGVIPLNDKKAMDLLSCLLDNMQSRESQTERSVNLSASFLRDLSESYDKISKAYDQSKDIAKSMLHRILERNCAESNKKNEIIDQLTEAIFEAFAIRLEITDREPSRLAHEVMTSTLAIRGAIQ